jgi:hypothetical protein
MKIHPLLPGVRVLPAAMVCAAVFLAVSMSGCIAWAQDPIPVKELKQNFDRIYKNEEVRIHGQVSAEKRVDSQTYKGFYLKDRFGDLILVRTTSPLPEISSFVTVTGVALRDADTGDVFVSETRREGGTAPAAAAAPAAAGGAPAPADDSARRQAEEQRMREEEERRKAEQEAADQRQMLMLGGIGLAIAVLIGIAVYLMRRKPEPELAAPMFAPSAPAQPPAEKTQPIMEDAYKTVRRDDVQTSATMDDYKTVRVYKTTKVLPGRLVILENHQETDTIMLSDQTGRGEIEIGRDSPDVTTGIRIKDKTNTLSRHQAKLIYSASSKEFKIVNLAGDSSNPTAVNGREMSLNESVVLQDGDILRMGNVELKFRAR